MSTDRRLLAQGFRRAQAVTRAHARSFYFASYLLFGLRRRAAFALYAFCRRLDDMVDAGDGQALPQRLQRARQAVAEVYRTLPALAAPALRGPAGPLDSTGALGPWEADEFAALGHCIRHYAIPEQPFQELISGMEMDLTRTRYATWAELDLYSYRVAGVVGLMLTPATR